MPLTTDEKLAALSREIIEAFDTVDGGVHPGFRPAHAKGILLTGAFTPSPEADALTRAPHVQRHSTPVTLRFSNFAGIPTIPDNDPQGAGPRGCAVRFHLAEHSHTDIVAHSADGFPVRTAEGLLGFLRAIAATDPAGPHPNAIEQFLAANPAALDFVQIPKPIPVSFATETFFAVSAFKFTNADGVGRYGRYRLVPLAGSDYLSDADAAARGPDFLFDDIRRRVAQGPVGFRVVVQLAAEGDVTDDATVRWPQDRPQITFGDIALTAIPSDDAEQQRHLIFDPIPRVDGIDASADPLFEPRANVYLLSGRRRRAAAPR
jgi:catalase